MVTTKTCLYQTVAQSLCFDSTGDIVEFNRDIQWEIEHAPPEEALALAQIKLDANRRFYWAVQNAG